MPLTDDWRSDTQSRLERSLLFTRLKTLSDTDPAGHAAVDLVQEAAHYACHRTKTIVRHMGEFTLHDGDHLFRVLHLMERIAQVDIIDKLSIPELLLLCVSAFLHDIGMAPDERTVIAWKKTWDVNPEVDDCDEEEFHNFRRYCSARPEQEAQLAAFLEQGDNTAADLQKSYLISDYIRLTHSDRAKEIIQNDWMGKIRYRDVDLTVELAAICSSHNADPLTILEMDKHLLCGQDTFACLPLVAMLLRLSDLLDFDAKRTPEVLFSHLFVRHPVSLKEWNKHRAVEAWQIGPESIVFHAKCKHPAIEASVHDFCDLIDNELGACSNVAVQLNNISRDNGRDILIRIPFKVDRSKIETQKNISGKPEYIYRKTQFTLSKSQVIDLLMGTKLYGDPEVALRELIQNSIDACLLRAALEQSWGNSYIPEIVIRYSTGESGRVLTIADNGTGMDQHIIDTYYSQIGSSFYKSAEFYDMKSQSNAQFTPTSRFGIGILSCFMVADSMVVETRRVYAPHASSDPIELTIEGQESIFWIKPGSRKTPGTTTKLFLRKSKNPWEQMDEDSFISAVENVIPNPPFKITIEGQSKKRTRDQKSFRGLKASSLKDYSWERNPNVRELSFDFSDRKKGFVGSVIIALLEKRGSPVKSVEMRSRTVTIDDETYTLKKSIGISGKVIELHSSTITVDEDGDVEQSETTSHLANSKSRVSLHGIEVPTTLFPEQWNVQNNQVRLAWPFPALLVIDVCGSLDLDLNSSRTQILQGDKWAKFEDALAFEICTKISLAVAKPYWTKLYKVLSDGSKSSRFLRCLDVVNKKTSTSGRKRSYRKP
ncbi:MAG TPA: ATP-binding protein [Pirellulales bacterium]|jgi:hypothetical protein